MLQWSIWHAPFPDIKSAQKLGLFGFDGPTILQSKITSTINITNSILHPVQCSNLSVVDPEGLPVEQVGEALGPVALDDPLAAVQAREAVHVAAGEGREIKKVWASIALGSVFFFNFVK